MTLTLSNAMPPAKPAAKKRSTLQFAGLNKAPATKPSAKTSKIEVGDDDDKAGGSREGKVALPFWVPTAARQQLRLLAVQEDTKMQALMTEALNGLFKDRGLPPIA